MFKNAGIVPDALIKSVVKFFINIFFNVKVQGLENYSKAGDKVIIIANHTSLIDGILLAAYLPEKIMFVVNTHIAEKWWAKPFLSLIDYLAIDPTNPMSVKTIIDEVNAGKKCMIFPEGRVSVTGNLMKVYEGAGLVADKTNATILPIRIKGAQYSKFAYVKDKEKTYWFTKVSIKILPPTKFHVDEDVKGRGRRQDVSTQLYKLMVDMYYKTSNREHNLFKSLVNAKKVFGGHRLILEDARRRPISYNSLIKQSYVLGEAFKEIVKEDRIGLMIFNSCDLAISFFGLIAVDKIPAMINFTSGLNSILGACKTGNIKTIITSHKFIETLELMVLEQSIKDAGIRLIYLEDVKISLKAKLTGIFKSKTSYLPKRDGNDASIILFTSGSEGTPKGVVLSHKNLQSNRYQMLGVLSLNSRDVFFSCLPLFHSFGLSTSFLLPVLSGMKSFLFPSPLKYRVVPELNYDTSATVILGTDTFLSGYAKLGHQYDFFNTRYVIAGAEKLKDSTRLAWMFKFGVRILEGYGATETSPVIAVNTPMYLKAGTVGKILPGMEYKLEKVDGIEEGQKLLVRGDNVMLGYMRHDNPGVLQPLGNDDWYDTGDIVDVDDEGFIAIKGRLKRFAKIAGEMISLGAVEFAINTLWEGYLQGVVVVPDDKRGEQLVLITQKEDACANDLVEHFRKSGLSELWIPKKILVMKEPPVLGAGKFDYLGCQKMVLAKHEKGEI
ncbi:MAG: AMP-binding protein [Rickettsiales bacterium]|nr:AMP-binding protein [Rickettsiales bacterium]